MIKAQENLSQNAEKKNLAGQSFEGQNLAGADFSNADIRGTNFTGAILVGANFTGAKCGLQKRWKIFIVAISWGLSWLSGRLVGLSVVFFSSLFNVSGDTFNIKGYLNDSLDFLLVFSIIGTAIIIVALVGGIANAIGVATSMALASQLVASIAVLISVVVVWKVVAASTLAQATFWTFIFTEIYILLSAYVGWKSITLEKKHFFIRFLSIFLATWKGTSFRGANLTDANLSKAIVRNTDFRQSNITRTCWYHAKKPDLVCPGATYLKNKSLRQVLITGDGQNKNFERQDLRGVNLQGANLENASFIDTDFYQANLQEANLSRAILVRANLERADLRGANLTGSCIQNWIITESTKLDGIICDYVYLKWDKGDKRDQMPPRGKFREDGFVTFVQYILETVELYHEKDINPRLALNVLQKMSRDYDEPFDIVAVGKKGERAFIQVKASEDIIRENFKEDYYERYNTDLKLWAGNTHQSPPSVNRLIEKKINETASEQTDDFKFVDIRYVDGNLDGNYTKVYQGEVNMSGDRTIDTGGGDYIQQKGSFGIGVNKGKIKAEKIAGTINEAQNEVLPMIESLRKQIKAIDNQEVRTEALEHLEDVETETKSSLPKQSRLKSSLMTLFNLVKDIAVVANAVTALAERLGVQLFS